MIELRSTSPNDTRAIAAAIATLARGGDLIVLSGEMGAGKTAFAQGFARALGIHEPVTSPTYTLVHSYRAGQLTVHHADLYRLDHTDEVADLGLDEMLDEASIVLVEWGDVVDLGPQLLVHLRVADDGDGDCVGDDVGVSGRTIEVSSSDRRWAVRWERLEAALLPWSVS